MIKFQLVSLKGLQFDDSVYEVLLPTVDGSIAVLSDHMPIVSAAAPGVISVRRQSSDADNAMEQFATSGGLIEVDGKHIRFLADDVADTEGTSEDDALKAVARAEELIKNASDQISLEEAHRQFKYSQARLHVTRLKKRRH